MPQRFILWLLYIVLFPWHVCYAQWKQETFIIGADFNPAPLSLSSGDSIQYVADVQAAKDAYINLFMGYTNTGRYLDSNYIQYQLQTIEKYGIRMLYKVTDNFTLKNADQVFNFCVGLDSIIGKILIGYNIQDEPRLSDLLNVNNWNVAIAQRDPQRLGYVNLLPIYGFQSRKEYENYLTEFLANPHDLNVSLGVVSYDFYPFVYGEMRPDYFYNLSIIRKMAGGRPFWFYVQSVQHSIYDDPTQYQLEFQIFCPIAYGAKGYVFYTYETIPHSNNYTYGDAIISRNGTPSDKYAMISKINRYVHDIAGPVVMNSDFLGVFHVSNQPFGQSLPSDEFVNADMPVISQVSDQNIFAGIFHSRLNKSEYNVIFVNKADKSLKNVPISIRGNHVGHIMFSRKLDDDVRTANFKFISSTYDASSNLTRLVLDFAPGELRVLKVLNMDNAYEDVIYPKEFNVSVYPNPISSSARIVCSLSQSASVSIGIYGMDGRLRQLILPLTHLAPGKYYLYFDKPKVETGFYIIALKANGKFRASAKILLN